MAHRKVHRRYKIFPDAYYQWLISCLQIAKSDSRISNLDDYERQSIRNPRKWAHTAKFEEVATIMTKIGFPVTVTGFDVNGGRFQGYQLYSEYRKFFKKHNINETLDYVAEHKFFVTTSREFAKCFTLYSQLINGQFFIINKDFKLFKRTLARTNKTLYDDYTPTDAEALRVLCEVFANVFSGKDINGLNFSDYSVLFLLAKYDSAPLSQRSIKEILGMLKFSNTGTRSLNKLCHGGYTELFGTKQNRCYTLTEKGWIAIKRAIDDYFQGVKMWKTIPSINQKSQNGSSTIGIKKEELAAAN